MTTATIQKTFEGRCGTDLRAYFEVRVDGMCVGGSSRKWFATAIAAAIEAGHIGSEGDTDMALTKWAAANDRALFDRILKLPA